MWNGKKLIRWNHPKRGQMNEAQFQQNVVDLARMCGWLIHHDRGDYRECIAGDPGFPDLVLARRGRVIFAELKTETGKTSTAQGAWIDALAGSDDEEANDWLDHHETYLWRPRNIDKISTLLSPRTR